MFIHVEIKKTELRRISHLKGDRQNSIYLKKIKYLNPLTTGPDYIWFFLTH